MAKCPKCDARKGKRYCVALDTQICSLCCGEHRLETIACPAECEYLEAEHYQLARRKQRAMSSGRKLLETLAEVFLYDDSREFAFLLVADVYWWTRKQSSDGTSMTNGELCAAFKEVEERQSPVFAELSSASSLGKFLADLMQQGPKHQEHLGGLEQDRPGRRQIEVVTSLARHLAGLPAESLSFQDLLGDYFDQLDFVADLDYSPDEELPNSGGASDGGDAPGGLILPPGS